MVNYETILRVAKILARATSPEQAEAQTALESALKRMLRDGVNFQDLLTLPKEELFQNTLFKLADLIVLQQDSLSPAGKRAAYEHYAVLIVAKFSGNQTGNSSSEQGSSSYEEREPSRGEAAREYERRRKAEEDAREKADGQSYGSHRAEEKSSGYSEQPFKRENSKTPKSNNSYKFKLGKLHFSFSPAGFFSAIQILFGRGSITWHALRQPGSAFRLFAASMLWGMGFSGVVLIVAGLFHALTNTGPLWDITLKNAFSFLAAIGTIWKTRAFYLAGWFR
jgi:hypothetical protein